jgi:hypothetical protein
MSAIWQTPIVALAIMAWMSAPPKSLGEASQREAFRRQLAGKSHASLTNLGQPMEIPLVPPAAAPPATSGDDAAAQATGDKAAAKPDDKTKPAADQAPQKPAADQAPQKDEKWWREKVSTANETLRRDQMMNDALQTKINTLKRDSVNFDNPNKQRDARDQLNAAMAELDRSQKVIEEDKKAIAAIQDDARRMNVPASWIR